MDFLNFIEAIMVAMALISFTLFLINRKKFKYLKFIGWYPLGSFLQILILHNCSSLRIVHSTISIFIALEFAIIYHFFFQIILSEKLIKALRILCLGFLIYLLYMWIFTNSFLERPEKIYVVQSLFILIPCFFYFAQLFTIPPTIRLMESPIFWITTGCLFFFSCTAPVFYVYTILNLLGEFDILYWIIYIAYSIFFICIAKAFLCKPIQIEDRVL